MEASSAIASDPETQRALFIYYLNKIYDGKLFLRENLPVVITKTHINVLKHALDELLQDVKAQITRMDHIYGMLNEKPVADFDAPMKTIMQSACDLRNNPDSAFVNDMDLMVHMQLVEHVNLISYRILRKIASMLGYHEIEQMLTECFDESKDDDELFYALAKEYLSPDGTSK